MIVVLDANVLYPPSLRDLLLTLAALDAFEVRWSEEILDEATNCVGETPAPLALYSVLLAGVGLGVVGITSRRGTARVGTARAARVEATA